MLFLRYCWAAYITCLAAMSWVKRSGEGKKLQFSDREDWGCSKFQFCPRNLLKMVDFHSQVLYFWKKIFQREEVFLEAEIYWVGGRAVAPLPSATCHWCLVTWQSVHLCQEWKEDTSTSSSGSLLVKMWLVVFQLCGLNPDVRQTYSRLLTLLAVVCDDFAVFFFTFILTHVLFTSL